MIRARYAFVLAVLGLAGIFLTAAAPVQAQDWRELWREWREDWRGGERERDFDRDSRGGRPRGTPGNFDFYVLALSWSPGFCELTGDRRDDSQCENGTGLGFVVHGLWPQYDRGYPSNCGAERSPSRMALDRAQGLFPNERLARYEWRKHGTCSGKSPADYFDDVRAARDKVVIPDLLKQVDSDKAMQPIDIQRAFVDANPGLRADMMSVQCRRRTLQEVHICFSKDLRGFQTCPEVARKSCRSGEIDVPAIR